VSPDPQFVDLEAYPLVADEAWALQQIYGANGNGAPAIHESWLPQNLGLLEDAPPVHPTLGGVGIAYPGKRHVFSGPQESAKTLAAYVVALEEIRRGEVVVLLDFEMGPYDAKTRLREMGASKQELSSLLYVSPDRGASPAAIGSLIAARPSLVVLDATAGAFSVEGLDDNSRKDVELWSRAWIDPFRREGIATIALDHVVKNSETRGAYAIGSERKVGGVDVHIGFHTVRELARGKSGLYRVTTHKDRGGMLKRGVLCEFAIESDPETHALSWEFRPSEEIPEGQTFRPTVLMEKISRWLELQSEPQSRNKIEENVQGKASGIRAALAALVSEGWLEEREGPNRARLMAVRNAYRQETDSVRPSSSQFVPSEGHSVFVPSSLPLKGGDEDESVTETRDEPRDEVIEF
jgi:hypothetical protein